jgi:hypothetical protein
LSGAAHFTLHQYVRITEGQYGTELTNATSFLLIDNLFTLETTRRRLPAERHACAVLP